MNKLLFFVILSISLFSCQGQKKIVPLNQLQKDFRETLFNIGIKSNDSIYMKSETLHVKIVQDSGYYIDEATNSLVRSYLLFKYYNPMKELDSVDIHIEYNGLTDKTTYSYTRQGIDKIYDRFSKNPLFMSIIPYLIRNTDANDIVYMDGTINDTPDYVSKEKFTFDGHGFWEFVYEYTSNCCDPKSDVHMNMDEILYASKYPKFPTRPDLFEYIIKEGRRYCKEKSINKKN